MSWVSEMGTVKRSQAGEAFRNMVRCPGQMRDDLEALMAESSLLRGDFWVLDHFLTGSVELRSPGLDMDLVLALLDPTVKTWQLALSDGESVLVYDGEKGWDLFSPFGVVQRKWLELLAHEVSNWEA